MDSIPLEGETLASRFSGDSAAPRGQGVTQAVAIRRWALKRWSTGAAAGPSAASFAIAGEKDLTRHLITGVFLW